MKQTKRTPREVATKLARFALNALAAATVLPGMAMVATAVATLAF